MCAHSVEGLLNPVATGGVGAVNVYYDAAGNLSRDEGDFEYGYDYGNRLTKIEYDDGSHEIDTTDSIFAAGGVAFAGE